MEKPFLVLLPRTFQTTAGARERAKVWCIGSVNWEVRLPSFHPHPPQTSRITPPVFVDPWKHIPNLFDPG